jgi:PAS domain S-box-containing protein
MNPKPHSRSNRTWTPYFVLVVALLATGIVTWYVAVTAHAKDQLRFQNAVDRTGTLIANRLERYISLLRSTGGLFAVSRSVSPEEFHAYVTQLDLPGNYPGIQGVGFSLRLPATSKDSLVAAMRSQYPDFKIRPDEDRPEYHTIIYLEPLDRRNRVAIGYDMFSDSTRRAAMVRARDSGAAAASGKVTLVQEIDPQKQAGFLIYYPVYRGGSIPSTVSGRRASLIGFVYSPFRGNDLLRGIIRAASEPRVDFQVFDGAALSAGDLLYDSGSDTTLEGDPEFTDTTTISVGGRPWNLLFKVRSGFYVSSNREIVPYIALAGVLVALLLFAVTRSQSKARAEAEKIAEDLRQSQQALRASELRLRRLVDSNVLAIIIADMAGNVIEANDAFLKLIGMSREELQAGEVNWADMTPSEYWSLDREAIRTMRTSGSHAPYEKEFVRFDGTRVPVMVGTAYLGGPEDLGVSFLLDLSERVEAERQLKLAKEVAEQASRAKDQFLAVLSHELRTPLTPVLTAIHLLKDISDPVPEMTDLLEIIHRNVDLEARLIDDLLDLTRIANGKLQLSLEIVDAHPLLRNALEICTTDIASKHLTAIVELDAEVHHVEADPARLQQVFWNLLKNAVKFTPEGGRVTLRSSNRDGMLHIEVVDNGIGIDPEVLPRIFNAFEQGEQTITRRFGGLGLGLAISRMLVDLHGGTLTARSQGKGRGALFTIELATVAAAAVAPNEEGESDHGTGIDRMVQILLVEDHRDTGDMIRRLLEHEGYHVTLASSVGEAIDAASLRRFDLLISDIGLPDGTGLELLRTLAAAGPLKAIALSGFGMEEDVRKSLAAGFAEHLTKPVSFMRLHETVRRLLN